VSERRPEPDEVPAAAIVDLDGLTGEILPALIARLRASRLAELEVRSAGWRVRLRRDLRGSRRGGAGHPGDSADADPADLPELAQASSPAVGYFTPAAGLAVGQAVANGDVLGSVDVLGIDQDVTSPIEGLVAAVLAEPGQAVEYGQALLQIDPLPGAVAALREPGTGPPSAAPETPSLEAFA
jgi:biotin carboxyl carrier protein